MASAVAIGLAAMMSVAPVAAPFMAYAEDSIVVPASTAAKTGTINITRMDTTSTPVKGSKFKAYRIFDLVQAANSDGRATYSLRVADGYSNIPGVQDIINDQDKLGNYSARELQELTNKIDTWVNDKNPAGAVESNVTGADGKATFSNLPLGWYLVVESQTVNGQTAIRPFMVALPSSKNDSSVVNGADTNDNEGTITDGANNQSTEWIYTVDVFPKDATSFWIDKNIINVNGAEENTEDYSTKHNVSTDAESAKGKLDTAGEGDLIKYEVVTTVPDYADTYFAKEYGSSTTDSTHKFIVTDYLSNGLSIQPHKTTETPTPITVVVDKGGANEYTAVPTTDYILTVQERLNNTPPADSNAANIADANKPDLQIEFTEAFLKKAAVKGKSLTITYYAMLNDLAVMGVNENGDGNTNDVYLEYSHNPHDTTSGKPENKLSPSNPDPNNNKNPNPDDPDGSDTSVYTYGIDLDKFTDEFIAAADSDTGLNDGADAKTPGAASNRPSEKATTKALAGAEFKLYHDKDLTDPVLFNRDKIIGTGHNTETNTWAKEDTTDMHTDADGTSHGAMIVTSDANGKAQFPRLDAGDYWIKEVKSPAGYTLLVNPIHVKIGVATDQATGKVTSGDISTLKIDDVAVAGVTTAKTDHTSYIVSTAASTEGTSGATNGELVVAIENHKGFTLPATGGAGIILLLSIAASGILVITAMLMKDKKRAVS